MLGADGRYRDGGGTANSVGGAASSGSPQTPHTLLTRLNIPTAAVKLISHRARSTPVDFDGPFPGIAPKISGFHELQRIRGSGPIAKWPARGLLYLPPLDF